MPGDGLLHLSTVTEVGVDKVGAYEQEDDLLFIEVLDDVWLQFFSWFDISIKPGGDDVLSLEVCQVGVEFFAQRLILVGVGDEDFVCHGMLLFYSCFEGFELRSEERRVGKEFRGWGWGWSC